MKVGDEINIVMTEDSESLFAFSKKDYTRWNNAKWYQKLIGKLFNSYRTRFIDLKPIETNYKGNGVYELKETKK